jgi:hypothetical protein
MNDLLIYGFDPYKFILYTTAFSLMFVFYEHSLCETKISTAIKDVQSISSDLSEITTTVYPSKFSELEKLSNEMIMLASREQLPTIIENFNFFYGFF